jgi:hypothetical protein
MRVYFDSIVCFGVSYESSATGKAQGLSNLIYCCRHAQNAVRQLLELWQEFRGYNENRGLCGQIHVSINAAFCSLQFLLTAGGRNLEDLVLELKDIGLAGFDRGKEEAAYYSVTVGVKLPCATEICFPSLFRARISFSGNRYSP